MHRLRCATEAILPNIKTPNLVVGGQVPDLDLRGVTRGDIPTIGADGQIRNPAGVPGRQHQLDPVHANGLGRRHEAVGKHLRAALLVDLLDRLLCHVDLRHGLLQDPFALGGGRRSGRRSGACSQSGCYRRRNCEDRNPQTQPSHRARDPQSRCFTHCFTHPASRCLIRSGSPSNNGSLIHQLMLSVSL